MAKKYEHIEAGKIYITSNYGMFKELLGNREVKEDRVAAIMDSIAKVGYRNSPIVVNRNMEVIDGQGRLEACRRLNIPVLYTFDDNAGIDECIAMNIKMRNWTVEDYISSYAKRGFENYIKLVELYEKYNHKFPYMTIAKTMSAILDTTGTRKRILEGTFKTSADKDGVGCLEFFDAMYETICQTDGRTATLYDVLSGLYFFNLIDVERMVEQFNKYADYTASYMGDVNSCLDALQTIYNYRKKTKFFFKDKYLTIMDERRCKPGSRTEEEE